jgi:glutathione reductase (NADPH)
MLEKEKKTRPSPDYDLFVIGGGSGGVRAARVAAGHGARVAIAEEYRYGGTCVIRGCIPKKLFVYAAEVGHDLADAAGFGWSIGPATFDWPTLVRNKDAEIDRLNRIYLSLLESAGVRIYQARARLAGAHTVEVAGDAVTAGTVLVATGATPFIPPFPGAGLAVSSNEVFHLPSLPRSVAIAGGGYIAVEFAHIFNGLGVETTLVHRGDLVLRGFDEDLRRHVTEALAKQGVRLRTGVHIQSIEAHGDRRRLTFTDGEHLEVDLVMSAVGRVPNTRDLGLETAGVALGERGDIIVDELSRTTADTIYAVGDCTARPQLTPIAIRDGHAFADTVFGNQRRPIDHRFIPTAVFSQPPTATIGLTEADARVAGAVTIYEAHFRPLKHTLSGRDEKTYLKLVVATDTQRVLGAHMMGESAPEIMQIIAVAMQMGATKADFDATLAIHPTTAEEFVLLRTPRA